MKSCVNISVKSFKSEKLNISLWISSLTFVKISNKLFLFQSLHSYQSLKLFLKKAYSTYQIIWFLKPLFKKEFISIQLTDAMQ